MGTLLYSIALFATMSRRLITSLYKMTEYKPLLHSLSIHVHAAWMLALCVVVRLDTQTQVG